jgi:chromosome segregation ATPase
MPFHINTIYLILQSIVVITQEILMLFSIGNLITLVIVLVFFIIYHRLTANNRSLEKVKRLSEKLQNELNEYVRTRAEELRHYGIDLDVQQKAAKIALEKLQSAQSAVTEKAGAIGSIADRFKEYDEVLSKLMEMTARVDENLARIHEDETFAEGVNRKLDLAKKSLIAIERELPLLRESFAQDAQRTIETFRDSILSELQEELSSTATELNSVRDEAMAAFSQAQSTRTLVDEELAKALETAKERAASIEDKAFSTLTESFNQQLREHSESTNNQMAQLGQDTTRHVGELRSAIGEFKENWRKEAQEMLADMTAKLGEAEEIFAQKATEIAGIMDKSSEKARESETNLAATAAKAKQDVAEMLKEIDSLEESLRSSMESTKTRIEEEFAGFGQAFEDHRTRFEANFSAETSALGGALVKLGKNIETLKDSAYENAQEKLEGFEDELLSELSEKKSMSFKQLDGWLSEMEKTLSGIVSEAGARRSAEEAKYTEQFRSHMNKLRDDLHGQLEKLSRNIEVVRDNVLAQQASAMKELEEMRLNQKES